MTSRRDDVTDIQNLKASYCAYVDSATADPGTARQLLGDVFQPDIVGDYGFRVFDGAGELAGFLCDALVSASEWALHTLHSPRIELAGDRAAGSWTVVAYMKRREGGAIDTVFGRYADEFIRTPQGWRIARIKFDRLS